MYSKNLVSNYF